MDARTPLAWPNSLLSGAPLAGAALLLRLMGVERASALGGALGRGIGPLRPAHRTALRNLAAAFPDQARHRRHAVVAAMWENRGRSVAEFVHRAAMARDGRIVERDPDVLAAFLGRTGPRLVLAGQGTRFDPGLDGLLPLPAVHYARIRDPLLERARAVIRGLEPGGDLLQTEPALPRRTLRALLEGRVVGMTTNLRGCPCLPLAPEAPAILYPALLARAAEAPILLARLLRPAGAACLERRLELIEPPVTADRRADVAATAALLAEALTRAVREAPQQWMWGNRPATPVEAGKP